MQKDQTKQELHGQIVEKPSQISRYESRQFLYGQVKERSQERRMGVRGTKFDKASAWRRVTLGSVNLENFVAMCRSANKQS
jgi:hypothetical protein